MDMSMNMETSHYVYVLINAAKTKTYVGYTVNPARRLRQHNGEIKGGARRTRGDSWEFAMIIDCPQFDKHTALSFEWHMKDHRWVKRKRLRDPLENCQALFTECLANPKFAHCSVNVSYQTFLA